MNTTFFGVLCVGLFVGVFVLAIADAARQEKAAARADLQALASNLVGFRSLAGGERRPERVVPAAAGLLAAVTRLLPAVERARYAEEYLSELWDLAQSGSGGGRQLRYAFRQFFRSLPMGFALRYPRRRSAAP